MKPRYLPRGAVVASLKPMYWFTLHHRLPTTASRRILDFTGASQPLPSGSVVERLTLGGRPAERITVGATERPRAVLYLHGGGYTVGSLTTHRSLAAFLARESGAVVFALDYRLAPEHPYPAAVDDAVAAFMDIVRAHGFAPDQIAISGDSAGGGLAVATTRRLIDDHGVTPGALALLSPWTDPSDEHVTKSRDLVVNQAWGRKNAAAYRGQADPKTPGYAPMYASMSGLPPMLVHVGTSELLLPQIRRFVETARAGGVDVEYREFPELWHSGHTQAGMVREAADAVHAVGVFIRAHLDSAYAASAARAGQSGAPTDGEAIPAPRRRRRATSASAPNPTA
ncbi:Acetyl esterase/lipase [Frankineae bacterium MT45]|nr:Acetyl esterase/lipase [Frankineae bacterium MT45]